MTITFRLPGLFKIEGLSWAVPYGMKLEVRGD